MMILLLTACGGGETDEVQEKLKFDNASSVNAEDFSSDVIDWANSKAINLKEVKENPKDAAILSFLKADLDVRRSADPHQKITKNDFEIAEKAFGFAKKEIGEIETNIQNAKLSLANSFAGFQHKNLREVLDVVDQITKEGTIIDRSLRKEKIPSAYYGGCGSNFKDNILLTSSLSQFMDILKTHPIKIDRFFSSCIHSFDKKEWGDGKSAIDLMDMKSLTENTNKADLPPAPIDPQLLGHFVKDFEASYKGERQKHYVKSTSLTIGKLSNHIGKNTLVQSLDFLANERQALAREAKDDTWEDFGVLRFINLRTPISGRYISMKERACALCKQGKVSKTAGGESCIFNFTFEKRNLTYIDCKLPDCKKCYWYHTDGSVALEFVKDKAIPLYDRILSTQYTNQDVLYQDLGRLHWMLAHAIIYKRGDAAIFENLINSLIVYQKKKSLPELKIRRYKLNVLPDLEALVTPDIELYAKNYRSIYED